MGGWKLRSEGNDRVYKFKSDMTLRAGDTIRLHTGRGGEAWEVLFHPDRSFTKTRLDAPADLADPDEPGSPVRMKP